MKIQNRYALAVFAALLFPAVDAGLAAEAKRPNVVIFFTDDQGTLDANCYGSKDLHTPAMDELAATGVRFTQAYAHTVCCPSRALRRCFVWRLAFCCDLPWSFCRCPVWPAGAGTVTTSWHLGQRTRRPALASAARSKWPVEQRKVMGIRTRERG